MKDTILNILGIVLFYGIIIFGVIALNYRVGQINESVENNYVEVER